MNLNEHNCEIDSVRDRYSWLNVTFQQAEKIYQYELGKNIHSEKYYFSVWEEWDYELTVFKEILDDEQFKNYQYFQNENKRSYEQSLEDEDNAKTETIALNQKLIDFYETKLLPDLFNDSFFSLDLSNDKAKITYLKAEYKRFLFDTKKQVLTEHFRYNRSFRPNALKASLLQHRLSCIFPNYSAFKTYIDEPTQAVAHYLVKSFLHIPEGTKQLLATKLAELNEFKMDIFEKYYGDRRGWLISTEGWSDQEENECRTMTLLLLDKGKCDF